MLAIAVLIAGYCIGINKIKKVYVFNKSLSTVGIFSFISLFCIYCLYIFSINNGVVFNNVFLNKWTGIHCDSTNNNKYLTHIKDTQDNIISDSKSNHNNNNSDNSSNNDNASTNNSNKDTNNINEQNIKMNTPLNCNFQSFR